MKDTTDAERESTKFSCQKRHCLSPPPASSEHACLGESEKERKAWKVPPTEDLMREHGVLRRIMLVYDEIARRLKQGEEFPLASVGGSQ